MSENLDRGGIELKWEYIIGVVKELGVVKKVEIRGGKLAEERADFAQFLASVIEEKGALSFAGAVVDAGVLSRLFGISADVREELAQRGMCMVVSATSDRRWMVRVVARRDLAGLNVRTLAGSYRELFLALRRGVETREIRMGSDEMTEAVLSVSKIFENLSVAAQERFRSQSMSPEFLTRSPDLV